MKSIVFVLVMIFSAAAYSQGKGSSGRKIISIGAMALNSSTSQGGAGPSGSSILTRSEFVYAKERWGVGLLFDYDLHGANEKDSAYGIKFETYISNFFFELKSTVLEN